MYIHICVVYTYICIYIYMYIYVNIHIYLYMYSGPQEYGAGAVGLGSKITCKAYPSFHNYTRYFQCTGTPCSIHATYFAPRTRISTRINMHISKKPLLRLSKMDDGEHQMMPKPELHRPARNGGRWGCKSRRYKSHRRWHKVIIGNRPYRPFVLPIHTARWSRAVTKGWDRAVSVECQTARCV